MKESHLYAIITLLLIIIILGGFMKCENPAPLKLINTDSLASIAYNKGYEIAKLEQIGKVKEDTVKSTVIRWKVLKAKIDTIHDTIVKEVVAICNDVINTQADYIEHLKFTNAKQDTLIGLWIDTHKADSVNKVVLINAMDSLTKSRRKFWNGFKWGFIAGNVTGGVVVGGLVRD